MKSEHIMQKNITLSAEESLIKKARLKAQQEHTTLNSRFRQWLTCYVGANSAADDYTQLMKKLDYVQPDKTFSRDELNER
ncbi:MAG: hypothetical protein ACC707_00840 [Thiohalomonadales bacterium]